MPNQFTKAKENGYELKTSEETKKKISESNRGRVLSEETKKKISESRIKFLKENPEQHPWKRKEKFISEPCEKLKEMLRSENITFEEEYRISEKRMFSADIAFPDLKIIIEVNGNQHYDNKGNLKPYYIRREKFINSLGWEVINIHYLQVYKILNFVSLEKLKKSVKNYSIPKYFDAKKKKEIRISKIKKCDKNRKRQIIRNKIEKIENSDITFSKFGWVNKVSLILDIKPQRVNSWMKRNMSEFLEKNCFKRKKCLALSS